MEPAFLGCNSARAYAVGDDDEVDALGSMSAHIIDDLCDSKSRPWNYPRFV